MEDNFMISIFRIFRQIYKYRVNFAENLCCPGILFRQMFFSLWLNAFFVQFFRLIPGIGVAGTAVEVILVEGYNVQL